MPNVQVSYNIVEIAVVLGHEEVPQGFEVRVPWCLRLRPCTHVLSGTLSLASPAHPDLCVWLQLLHRTKAAKTGNLNESGVPESKARLAVRRAFDEPAISDVGVILNPGVLERVPEGWQLLDRTAAGQPANLNHMTNGPPIYLCYKRVAADAPPNAKRLQELDLLWPGDKPASGFTKVAKTLGAVHSEADLNTGTSYQKVRLLGLDVLWLALAGRGGTHANVAWCWGSAQQVFLAFRRSGFVHPPHADCFITGTYETSQGMMQLYGIQPSACTTLYGTFNHQRDCMQLVLVPYRHYQPGSQRTGFKALGITYPKPKPALFLEPGYTVDFVIDEEWRVLKGHYAIGA